MEYKKRTKAELNKQYNDWNKFINETEDVSDLKGFLKTIVDIKGTPEMKRIRQEIIDDQGKKQHILDKIKGRQTDQQLMILVEKANNKIRLTDARKGLSERVLTKLRTVKRDAVDHLNYKEAAKQFGKRDVDIRVTEFQEKYPTVGSIEAQREIISRLQSESRMKDVGTKPATPFDIAWTKWISEYRYLRGEPQDMDQDLANLKEMKKYASYGGYFRTYKRSGLDREEAKLARQELNKKINYLEGLEAQAQTEIREHEKRRKKGETLSPPKVEPETTVEETLVAEKEEELSPSDKASQEFLRRSKE